MLRAEVIELGTAEWASPVVLVPKNDATMRFCVDYRNLNAAVVWESYLILLLDEFVYCLGDATVFASLDCNSGYWQV